ncbi:hypothetical protein LTR37_017028 [Vermiconidia calcicola]|uniref:Uncharacterized protein n=1 Tax=Vermiconidia calcicola TaxID=1690605 RepID=A0ACC3MMM3_9PEZI|nr:hypothetical protein LTR37_017028 [Vermiconidia calcicola]
MQNQQPWSSFHPHSQRRGMQVHAVPESDKALDASGKKLPWAYDVDASRLSAENREPVEKGPFGRSQRRSRSGLSRSRSKTAEPRREEDRIKAEQMASEDAVFGSLRRKEEGSGRGEVDVNAAGQAATGEAEATEVMLYGFGEELQWAALDHYERVSGGGILEDYDRQPPGQRYDVARSLSRATSQRSLTRAALKKKNRYAGGMHWIKVTFESRGPAELACARSPHIIKGHLVYAEPFMGRGPGRDEAILASQAGAQITNDVLPMTFATDVVNPIEGSPNGSSTTATSATVQQSRQPEMSRVGATRTAQSSSNNDAMTPQNQNQQQVQSSSQPTPSTANRRRISGINAFKPLDASLAFQPKQAKPSWSAWLGAGEVIGATVPKREDGSFDYERASLYWRAFYLVDSWLGTDWCGLRGD